MFLFQGKHKSFKDSNKKHKPKKPKHHHSSSEEEWVEKVVILKKKEPESQKRAADSSDSDEPKLGAKAREDWMNLPSTHFTDPISNLDKKKIKEEQRKQEREKEMYNPRECARELNPYWKNGGDGLPKFQKPEGDDDYCKPDTSRNNPPNIRQKRQSNWKKFKDDKVHSKDIDLKIKETDKQLSENVYTDISDKDLNLLGAKIVKAEIMGNTKLANELRQKLENARTQQTVQSSKDDVLLTHTDAQGRSQPLKSNSHEYFNNKRRKNIETHEGGNRIRYFADDDKYSLQQMFENEKYNTVEDSNKEFSNMTKKVGKNDDLDDIFSDNIRKKDSSAKTDAKNRDRAISQHYSISKSLDNCNMCIQSEYNPKHLMISMGETVYLGVTPYEPLTEDHCLIVPIRHTPCSTQLDENEWCDIINIRKALVRMFNSQSKGVIFFEYAAKLHNFPHMYIECVPVLKEEVNLATIYFKKAIDECEMEWSQNKKLISLKNKDVRKAIPKGLPYFSVSFGMEEGYAHVIEDEKLFPKNFAQEIIGGMLDIHHTKWRKPKMQNFEDQSKRVSHFSNVWKDFDCNL